MTISFNSIPIDIRTPGQFLEIDATKARQGLPAWTPKILLIGPRLAAGTLAPAGQLRRLSGRDSTRSWYGAASVLAQMAAAAFVANPYAEIYAYDLADDGAGVAATGTFTISGPATAAGVLNAYVAGRKVAVAVASADTATVIGTALAAAINAHADMPVTAANVAGVVTCTAKNKGTPGNAIDLRVNYAREDRLPAGVTVAVAAMSAGATDPAMTAAIAAIGDEWFDAIVTAYTSSTALAALEAELLSRWGPMRMLDGLIYGAERNTYSSLGAFGSARNSQFSTILGYRGGPNPPWEWAAAYAGIVEDSAARDPARPFQTLVLPGILAPGVHERFTQTERNLLLQDGISTYKVNAAGQVEIERAITTYQVDANGEGDTSWLDVNTPKTVSYLRRTLRARIAQKYPRHKLGNDGVTYGDGQAIVTPNVLRAEIIALFREWESAGLVENVDQFKRDLVVERDASDPNRVNALIPPDLINQLRVFAAQLQFRV